MNTIFLNENLVIFASNFKILNAKSKSDEKEIDEEEEKKWIDFEEPAAEDDEIGSGEAEESGGTEEDLEDEDFNEEE